MASTLTSADLTVTIKETITLHGYDQGSQNTLTIGSISEVFKRLVTCPASQTTTVATFATNVYDSVGAIDTQNAKYIRITNLDDTNPIELAIVGAATLYQVVLRKGESHVLGTPDDLMLAEADTSPSFGTMADIASIQANPGSDSVDLEVFVASA
tara:strand:+ start:85 stop:549 length:465 start_codon:yes stop_codon:yes gene_type:complete